VDEPRTHYQISLTARQAVGLFAGLLLALGLAFFFGLMAGYSGREVRREAEAGPGPADANSKGENANAAADLVVPPVETGVPVVAAGSPKSAAAATPLPEATPPATLQTFEDAAEEEAAPAAASRTTVAGGGQQPLSQAQAAAPRPAPAAKPSTAGGVWVQAASLSSHDEANALAARLGKHGFHVAVSSGAGPKGKVYRVRVGPYRSEDEASKAVARLTRQEKIRSPWIVPDGK